MLPGTLVVPIPSALVLAAALAGVWFTVPAAARDYQGADRHVPPRATISP
jgi:hypothetical protein